MTTYRFLDHKDYGLLIEMLLASGSIVEDGPIHLKKGVFRTFSTSWEIMQGYDLHHKMYFLFPHKIMSPERRLISYDQL